MTPLATDESVVARLLDGSIEFDDLSLSLMPQDELVALLQALRGHCLRLAGMVKELSDQIQIVDAFARPKTKRAFIYIDRHSSIVH